MEKGLSGWNKNKSFSGIHIHGPKKDEFISIADSLLNGILPKGWEWVNSSSNTIVARRSAPSTYYKEFLKKSAFERLKNIFRGNRSKRARLNREILIGKGFHSPTTYCWGGKRERPFFFTEGVDALVVVPYEDQDGTVVRTIDAADGTEYIVQTELTNILKAVLVLDITDFENIENIDIGEILSNVSILLDSAILHATVSKQLLDMDTVIVVPTSNELGNPVKVVTGPVANETTFIES